MAHDVRSLSRTNRVLRIPRTSSTPGVCAPPASARVRHCYTVKNGELRDDEVRGEHEDCQDAKGESDAGEAAAVSSSLSSFESTRRIRGCSCTVSDPRDGPREASGDHPRDASRDAGVCEFTPWDAGVIVGVSGCRPK